MNVFFEESGHFKAGAVLSQQGSAYQVELPGGRRCKVRGKEILLEFTEPAPAELIQRADQIAHGIDPAFLWECAPADEFEFAALANEYFGAVADAIERAALVMRLARSPVYFRRKGHGQYQRAPEHQLQAALAALERRRQQSELQANYEAELKERRLPDAFHGKIIGLLTQPDKNTIEYKALQKAAAELGTSAAQLMLDCGGIASARALHQACFLAEYFPHGTEFPAVNVTAAPIDALPLKIDALPLSDVKAFSIDDVTTTEIDDAFSVQPLADGRLRMGVHIAAPSLGIKRGDAIDAIARARLSTVYAPGEKITMLPDAVIDDFTLKAGGLRPVLSLYMIVDSATQEIVAHETRVEQIWIADNLRHNELDAMVTEEALAAGLGDYPHQAEIALLWPFAQARYEKRQQARAGYGLKREVLGHLDFNFYLEGERITILPRRRGAPLDLIVAELAILTNSLWGGLLAEYDVPAIYRAQRGVGPVPGQKRTRMQITPAPHEGLGVAQYAWSTSPLRRYVDLINQWQLLACLQHGVTARLAAPFKPKDADLYALAQNFDETYAAYADYQRRMERFWCLRWLQQHKWEQGRARVAGSVIKDDLVRLDEIPLLLQVPGLGVCARGARLLVDITAIDELALTASCQLVEWLDVAVEKMCL